MSITIIIPVFNEEGSISEVLSKVLKLKLDNLKKEIIVINDGSTDRTAEILQGFENTHELKILTHNKNLGKGMAIRTGLENSKGSIIAIQDSDLEYDPSQLPRLLEEILEGEAVIYGSRFMGSVENMTFLFYWGNKILSLFTRLLFRANITDMETGYKIFRKEIVENLELKSKRFDIEPELTAKILRKGITIKEIPINYQARAKDQKKITIKDGIIALFTLIKYRIY
jgi:glycosyltransferase involved in cell wall biosynthesis